MTANPIPIPFLAVVVTARAGQVPRINRSTGFSFSRPLLNSCIKVLCFVAMLLITSSQLTVKFTGHVDAFGNRSGRYGGAGYGVDCEIISGTISLNRKAVLNRLSGKLIDESRVRYFFARPGVSSLPSILEPMITPAGSMATIRGTLPP